MSGITYIMMVLGIMLAKGLGFVRNIIFASEFGASELTDIYFQVFSIATFLFTCIGTALGTLVIKNLNKPENALPSAQKQYVSRFICRISLVVIAVTAVMYVGADLIIKWFLLPGLDAAFLPAARQMMYIMLPSGLFVIVAYIIAGVLQNCKTFFVTSIMSLPYNVIIIAALLFKNLDIYTISIITTVGWALHALILLPSFYKNGFRIFYVDKSFGKSGGKEKSLEVFYIFISSIMFHMCFMFDKAAVSHDSGVATTIYYASNFFVTIASIFVVAMSNVSFPGISKSYEKADREAVKRITQQLISLLMAIIVPFILVAVVFGTDIMSVLYERGEFTRELTEQTATLFVIYTFGVFGYICQELFNKLLYLGSHYLIPVVGSVVIMVAKPIINYFIADMGVVPIALTTTVLFTVYAAVIAIAITKVTGNYATREFGKNIFKIILAGTAALAVWLVFRLTDFDPIGGKFGFLLPLAACGITYIAVVIVTGLYKYLLPKRSVG